MKERLGQRIRDFFRGPMPPEEESPLDPNPEWEELLAWARVDGRTEPEGGIMDMEPDDWALAIANAKRHAQRAERQRANGAEEAERQQPTVAAPQRPIVEEEAEWEAAIAEARRQAPQNLQADPAHRGDQRSPNAEPAEPQNQHLVAEAQQQNQHPVTEQAQPETQHNLDAEQAQPEPQHNLDAEQAEWQAAIERAEWQATIEQAKRRPALRATQPERPPQRQPIDQRAWEERIARARRWPTPPANDVSNAASSIRERLERLAARVSTPKPSPATPNEDDQWRAAITQAKKGNA